MKESERNYKRLVIKIGSSLFCSKKGKFDQDAFRHLLRQLILLVRPKKEVQKEIVIVSSGAIALGMDSLGLKSRPTELAYLQAAAAIGQNILMNNYNQVFKEGGVQIKQAQVLLTWDDFNDRRRYLNAKNTLLTLLKLGCTPIVNENDTVSTEEIRFGDNDRLSALVATLISAELLIILSDVDGLLDREKKLIKIVPQINSEIKNLAGSGDKTTSVGGMITKIEAVRIAVDSGIPSVIANGRTGIITKIVEDPFAGGRWTIFLPKKGLTQRQRWLAFGTKPKGKIIVDEGARVALLNKKSLLSVGVVSVEGDFQAGDIVSVLDREGNEFVRGKVGISSKKLDEVKARHFEKEIIHRDNIVIL